MTTTCCKSTASVSTEQERNNKQSRLWPWWLLLATATPFPAEKGSTLPIWHQKWALEALCLQGRLKTERTYSAMMGQRYFPAARVCSKPKVQKSEASDIADLKLTLYCWLETSNVARWLWTCWESVFTKHIMFNALKIFPIIISSDENLDYFACCESLKNNLE